MQSLSASFRSVSVKRAPLKRAAMIAVLALLSIALSSCSFFRQDAAGYKLAESERPLEIPPDLDVPETSGAMAVPGQSQSVMRSSVGTSASAAASSGSASTANSTGFTVSGDRAQTFERVGQALEAIEGVTIASRAELLGAFDISYGGSNFLVRVTETAAGSYISAVDPRGVPASGEAAARLIAALQAALQ